MSKKEPFTEKWLNDFERLSDGTYKRITTRPDTTVSTTLLESIPATLYGSTEHITTKGKESPTVAKTEHKENRKIKNAVKVTIDGEVYDSRLEAHMAGLFKQHGIRFERQVVFVLQPKFKYGNESIRDIRSIVDFVLPDYNMIVDPKGFANDIAPVKYKMLKRHLFDQGKYMEIVMPKSREECAELINRLIVKI